MWRQNTRKYSPAETVLQRENELLREMLRDKEKQLDDLRSERDEWRKQAQTLLLTQAHPQEPGKPRRWWQFGKKQ